jgi:methanobactin biosynthesis MbnP-like protein
MKNKLLSLPLLLVAFSGTRQKEYNPVKKPGMVKISFVNTVKGDQLQLNIATYKNPFSEQYTVSKFKYYISHVALTAPDKIYSEKESYHLVDEANPLSLSFYLVTEEGAYHSILFTLGVDSLRNVSGAQTGALDPLNDMFWTWNSGYVMAKMEGSSPQSKIVNNKFEYHIGGFSGADNVLKNIKLDLPSSTLLDIKEGKTCEITIEADLDKWWQQPNDLRIANNSICTTPGPLAKKIADNYAKMFTVKKIVNN